MKTIKEAGRTGDELERLYENSLTLEGGMGAVAWAALEMFRRGGMSQAQIQALREQMNTYFAKPTDDDCNSILGVLEKRLSDDRTSANVWY